MGPGTARLEGLLDRLGRVDGLLDRLGTMPPGLTNSALLALGCLHVRTLPFQVGITFTRSQPSNALPVGVLIGSICSTFACFPQSPEVGKALDRTTLCHRSMVSRSWVEFAQKAAALPAL